MKEAEPVLGSFVAPAGPRIPPHGTKARVAIVLDDWGYNLDAFSRLGSVGRPLTLAVLPGLPYSKKIAEEAFQQGHEIILHMPMEPRTGVRTEPHTLLVGMSADEIRTRLSDCMEDLPHGVGISNHQGSLASENESFMRTVLETVREKDYFYLDSLTTSRSIAGKLARELGIPVLERDVFLDNERAAQAIQGRLDELREIAKRRGRAIGIGHDEPLTVELIRENIPLFEREGIEIVKLSEILNL